MKAFKSNMDLLLSRVVRGKSELTMDMDGYTQLAADIVIAECESRGLSACFDGRFLLIRDLRQT